MSNGWRIDLNGTTLQGGDGDGDACLLAPPEGTGVPPQRTQDVTYPQRDGVEHFDDYYEPRIITALGLIGGGCQCTPPLVAAQALGSAWKRRCDDTELVLWTGCEGETVDLLTNGSFEVNLDPMLLSTGGFAKALSTTKSHSPTHSLKFTSTTSVDQVGYYPSFIGPVGTPARAGDTARVSGWFLAGGVGRTCKATIQFFDNAGLIGVTSATGADNSSTWIFLDTDDVVAPDGTVTMIAKWEILATINTEIHYLDDLSFLHSGAEQRATTGPFGAVGRPRVAEMPWRKGRNRVADGTFRFDAIDHRLYILDGTGAPGSGTHCVTLEDLPPDDPQIYNSEVVGSSAQHHWPLDFPRLGPVSQSTITGARLDVEDMIGSYGADLWAGYGVTNPDFPAQVVPPILYSLGLSAIQGPATFQPTVYPGSYSSGMIGWWSKQDNAASSPAGMAVTISGSTIGKDNTGALAPVLNFPGLVNKAMVPLVASAFGFDGAFDGQAVLVMVTWTATVVRVYVGSESGTPVLAQTETITSIPPAGGVVQVFAVGAKFSNVMQGWNAFGTTATNLSNATDMWTAAIDHAEDSALTIPSLGTECVPFTATIESTDDPGDIYIMRADGNYVGIAEATQNATRYRASSLDTNAGTAKRFSDLIDATNDILGDPFMTVAPGEVLHVFGTNSPDITICMRPAVLST